MPERYEPSSDFLRAIIADEVALSGGEFAEANLDRLITFTRDHDRANRDWATLLLSQETGDTPAIRAALLQAAEDDDAIVRAEAALGLAMRDRDVALPYVQIALHSETVSVPALEAAKICAHASLVADLRVWAEPSDYPFIDELAAKALEACEQGGC
jgi:hypothetical protein